MSDCCEASVRAPRLSPCPITGTSGIRVRLQTVKAILKESSLRRLRPATYYFCPEPACDGVYFSQQGELYSKYDVRTTVWQKEPVGRRVLCYCFGENELTIASEIEATGTSLALCLPDRRTTLQGATTRPRRGRSDVADLGEPALQATTALVAHSFPITTCRPGDPAPSRHNPGSSIAFR